MPDTGTIVNSQETGRAPLIVTHLGVDILNSYDFTIDPPTGILGSVGADAAQHINFQAEAPGEALIEVVGTGSGPHVGKPGAILATITEGGGGGDPETLHLEFGPALPKI